MPTIHIPWAACPDVASQAECQKVEARLRLYYKDEDVVIVVSPTSRHVIVSSGGANQTRSFEDLKIHLQPRPPRL